MPQVLTNKPPILNQSFGADIHDAECLLSKNFFSFFVNRTKSRSVDQSLAAAFDVDVIGGLSRLAGSALGGSAGEKAKEKKINLILFSYIHVYILSGWSWRTSKDIAS